MAEREGPEEEGREKAPRGSPRAAPRPRQHRTLKLMEGGAEGAALSPTEARKARAAREHLKAVFDPTPAGVPAWTIEGTHGQSYRVLVPAFPLREGAQCTCPDFTTRGLGTCKHLEATLAQAAASPPEGLGKAPERTVQVRWEDVEPAQREVVEALLAANPLTHAELVLALRKVGRKLTAPA